MTSSSALREELLNAEFERLARVRLLAPDSALEALDREANDWMLARVDELASVFATLTGKQALPPLSVTLEVHRSFGAAATRWFEAWKPFASIGTKAPWHEHMLALRSLQGTSDAPEREQLAKLEVVGMKVSRLVSERVKQSALWQLHFASLCKESIMPLLGTASFHFGWLVLFGRNDAYPSVAEPLLALWERGAWPAPLPDGTVSVYVPKRDIDGRIENFQQEKDALPSPAAWSQLVCDRLLSAPAKFTLGKLGPLPPPELPENPRELRTNERRARSPFQR